MQIRADGETVQILGPRQARVRSSSGKEWYAVDLDEGGGFCTCKGFSYRRRCRHLETVKRIAAGKAKVDLQEQLIETFDPRTLDLATSRYVAYDAIAASGRIPVGITVGKPRWKLPYEIAGYVSELAPYGAMFKLSGDAFAKAYDKRLESYGVQIIGPALARYGESLVLLCYEDVLAGEPCHRRRFASWWESTTGQRVPELSGDGVAQTARRVPRRGDAGAGPAPRSTFAGARA